MDTIAPSIGQGRLAFQIRRLEHLSLRTAQSRPASHSSLHHTVEIDPGLSRVCIPTQSAILLPDTTPCPPNGDEEVLGL
jgi:hypothetical protein